MSQRTSVACIASILSVIAPCTCFAVAADVMDIAPPSTDLDMAAAASSLTTETSTVDVESLSQLISPSESAALTTFSNLPLLTAGAADGSGGEDRWAVGVNFAIWAPGIVGDIGVGRFVPHVNASFLDILSDTDSVIGVTGLVRVSKGKIGGYFGGSYNKMGLDAGPQNRTHITSTIGILSFGLSYEVGRWAMDFTSTADQPARDLVLQLTAGGRYTGLAMDVDFAVLPDRSASEWWIDPMVGGAVSFPISQHLSIVGAGEIGGFGVASTFAWTASLALSWDFHIKEYPSSLQVGYLAIGDDYEDASGRAHFEWNTIMHGVLLNFNIRF